MSTRYNQQRFLTSPPQEWREKAEEVGGKAEVTRPIDELARELESLNVLLTAQELR